MGCLWYVAAPGVGYHGGRRTTAAAMVGVFFLPSFRLTNRVSGASQPPNHPKTNHQSHQISLYCDSTWYNVHTYIRAELLDRENKKTAFWPYSFFANVKEPQSDKEIFKRSVLPVRHGKYSKLPCCIYLATNIKWVDFTYFPNKIWFIQRENTRKQKISWKNNFYAPYQP